MKHAGVMGWPVENSRSPIVHGYWLKQYGIDGDYRLLPVPPADLERTLRALPAQGFAGCNLTIPHKEAAATIVDRVDSTAGRIGAVNTVVVMSDGMLEGRNTDAFGFLEGLRAARPDLRLRSGPVVVLGAGGASRAIVTALVDEGASEIRLINRSRARAEALGAGLGSAIDVIDWSERSAALAGAVLLVNTTKLGMIGQPSLDLPLDELPKTAVVNDIVYVPLETSLLAAARRRGNPTVDGLDMLLHQARPGFAAWFGVMPEVTPALRAAVVASLAPS